MKNKKPKVLFVNISEYNKNKLKVIKKNCTVYNFENPSRKKLIHFLKIKKFTRIDILITNIGIYYDTFVLKLFPNLKIILTPTTGINHLDLNYIKKNKIKLFSLKNNKKLKYVTSTAEHAWALILAISRNLVAYNNETLLGGKWERKKYINKNFQLYGKTIGIIGYGRLGKLISKYATAFGMKILVFDKKIKKSKIKSFSSLSKIFMLSDIVTINLTYDHTTHEIISKNILFKAKKNQVLINTSRGEIIQENALWSYLNLKKKRYAGLDVLVNDHKWTNKIPREKFKIIKKYNKNMLLTPHVGGVSIDAKNITREIILDILIKIIRNYKS